LKSRALHRRILGVPVDARPVVRSQVCALVACAGWQLDMPAKETLGYFREPGDRDALAKWVKQRARRVDGFALSLDMLLYGGLVPSRFIEDDLESLVARLDVLRELRALAPSAPIYVFAATMRISNNNVNEEEKTYWSEYGASIWRWSFLSDRATQSSSADDLQAAREIERKIPASIRKDYLATRARNHEIVKRCFGLVEAGIVDRLILPQDDTAEFGFNVAERRELQQLVASRGLSDRVAIYAGADEVMHALCARMVATLEARTPTRFYLALSDPKHFPGLTARYEDRPLHESLVNQVNEVGGTLVSNAKSADYLLAVHTQGTQQGDWAMQLPLSQSQPIPKPWLRRLREMVANGGDVCVIDLAYANGGDPRLIAALSEEIELASLAAYAGWNTASNSLGCALAQCVLARGRTNEATNRDLLALRFAEDYLYQSIYRQIVRIGLPTNADCETLRKHVAEVFVPAANQWLAANGFEQRLKSIRLPWSRTFEIDIEFESERSGR
jgi:hypothetical protein